jgi:glycosyltransferase involved in cell wall biosynthesis
MNSRVSVLINSYVRTTYLDAAFESVIRQSGAEPFEIVLNSAIDSPPFALDFQRRANAVGIDFKVVKVLPTAIGGLARGVVESRGDIIAVLDDDDLWEPGKMARLQKEFTQDPELGFFHNGQTFVDHANQPLSRLSPHRVVRHRSSRFPEGVSLRMAPEDVRAARRLLSLEPMFNNSSIAFRRTILESRLSTFERLGGSDDSFLFFCALASGCAVTATTDRLTRYRIHPQAATAGGPRGSNFAGRLAAYTVFMDRQVERVGLCEALSHGPLPRAAGLMLRRDLAHQRLLRAAVDKRVSEVSLTPDTRALMEPDGFAPTLTDLFAICLGLGSRLSNDFSRAAFLAWRMAW